MAKSDQTALIKENNQTQVETVKLTQADLKNLIYVKTNHLYVNSQERNLLLSVLRTA